MLVRVLVVIDINFLWCLIACMRQKQITPSHALSRHDIDLASFYNTNYSSWYGQTNIAHSALTIIVAYLFFVVGFVLLKPVTSVLQKINSEGSVSWY